MKIRTSASTLEHVHAAVEQAWRELRQALAGEPQLVIVQSSGAYDPDEVFGALRELCPDAPIQGATTCRGVLTERGSTLERGRGFSLWGVVDGEGDYGTGSASLGDDAKTAAATALLDAIASAGRPGEIPDLIWLSSSPGVEEEVLEGIASVVGKGARVAGGSAADDDVAGLWRVFTNHGALAEAVSIAVLYPSCRVATSFHSGYIPTETVGRVTRAEGRTVFEIDGLPAARVYNAWSGGILDEVLGTEASVIGLTSLFPLGRVQGTIGNTDIHLLSHPASVHPDGGLSLFTTVETGDELVLMTGTAASLTTRAGRVIDAAKDSRGIEKVLGGLLIYCAGCMLAVESDMDDVAQVAADAFEHAPFITGFTFGEQGCLLTDSNRHGNLMISAVVFGT